MRHAKDAVRNFHFMLFFLLVHFLFSLQNRRVKKNSGPSKVTSCTRESWIVRLWPSTQGPCTASFKKLLLLLLIIYSVVIVALGGKKQQRMSKRQKQVIWGRELGCDFRPLNSIEKQHGKCLSCNIKHSHVCMLYHLNCFSKVSNPRHREKKARRKQTNTLTVVIFWQRRYIFFHIF